MIRRKKEPPADQAVVRADVDPEAPEEQEEAVARDSQTPPDHDNPAADTDQPHETRRPESKAERRDRMYGSNES